MIDENYELSQDGGIAYTEDLKSFVRKGMRVQVPLLTLSMILEQLIGKVI